MGGALPSLFGLSEDQQSDVERTVGRVRSMTEYASDLIDAVKDTPLPDALKRVSPWWAGPLAEAVGDSVPPIKFLVKLLEKLPDKPPARELGVLACTLAYQRSAEEALQEVGARVRIPFSNATAGLKEK